MKNEDYSLKGLKREIGERIKKFRLDKAKSQKVLASELMVDQSTITNIERGGTFPKINYLRYFFDKYALSTNWVVAGEGEKYWDYEDSGYKGSSKVQEPRPQYDAQQPEPDKYQELYTLMKIPAIEQVMFAKLAECKIYFKKEVKSYYDRLEKEKREKQLKVARAKVRK